MQISGVQIEENFILDVKLPPPSPSQVGNLPHFEAVSPTTQLISHFKTNNIKPEDDSVMDNISVRGTNKKKFHEKSHYFTRASGSYFESEPFEWETKGFKVLILTKSFSTMLHRSEKASNYNVLKWNMEKKKR